MSADTSSQPLVVLDITGGVVQGEYTYPGTGVPIVHVLDFDRDDADLDEITSFGERVEEAVTAIESRSEHPDDLAQIAEWRQLVADMKEWASDTES